MNTQKLNCYCITLKRRHPTSRTTPEWSQKGRENNSTTPINKDLLPAHPISSAGERLKIERNDASDNTASLPNKYTID